MLAYHADSLWQLAMYKVLNEGLRKNHDIDNFYCVELDFTPLDLAFLQSRGYKVETGRLAAAKLMSPTTFLYNPYCSDFGFVPMLDKDPPL